MILFEISGFQPSKWTTPLQRIYEAFGLKRVSAVTALQLLYLSFSAPSRSPFPAKHSPLMLCNYLKSLNMRFEYVEVRPAAMAEWPAGSAPAKPPPAEQRLAAGRLHFSAALQLFALFGSFGPSACWLFALFGSFSPLACWLFWFCALFSSFGPSTCWLFRPFDLLALSALCAPQEAAGRGFAGLCRFFPQYP